MSKLSKEKILNNIKKLIAQANKLDSAGLISKATDLDLILIKLCAKKPSYVSIPPGASDSKRREVESENARIRERYERALAREAEELESEKRILERSSLLKRRHVPFSPKVESPTRKRNVFDVSSDKGAYDVAKSVQEQEDRRFSEELVDLNPIRFFTTRMYKKFPDLIDRAITSIEDSNPQEFFKNDLYKIDELARYSDRMKDAMREINQPASLKDISQLSNRFR